MGIAAAERMRTHFSWQVCASKTAALYEDVLARRAAQRPAVPAGA